MSDSPAARALGVEAKAVNLGKRINVRMFEPEGVIHQAPLAYRTPGGGVVAVYRFGVVVFIDAATDEQRAAIESIAPHVVEPADYRETEAAVLAPGGEDAVSASGKISLTDFSHERVLAVADVLAKSVALADDERHMGRVFERIEPLAASLATGVGMTLPSKRLLRLLGEALAAQARLVGRVEVQERPDLLWDRPDLNRLHARLAEEYELDDRARALARKLKVVEESAQTLADLAESRRMLRLEIAIVALIAFEIVLSLYDRIVG